MIFLRDFAWRFAGPTLDSEAAFLAALERSHFRENRPLPALQATSGESEFLRTGSLTVSLLAGGFCDVRISLELVPDEPSGFRLGELLFKLHNAVVWALDRHGATICDRDWLAGLESTEVPGRYELVLDFEPPDF